MPLLDPVDAHVQVHAAAGGTAYFLTQEEIGVAAQGLDRVDRIVIGHCDEVHATLLEPRVKRMRIVIAFPADPVEQRDCAHAGMDGVDVQIALHVLLYQWFVTTGSPVEKTFVTDCVSRPWQARPRREMLKK